MDRKLAAILAADVVGYSALMEADEARTHERLKAGREELFEPEIARHHGRVFKLMGDGMLAEFGSVVDAVECAVALQRGLVERNAAVPEDQRIQVRIGINLGEVIVEGEDRFGEGVNIAARLQELAPPGGICVSGKVAKEVEKKLAFGFEPMGGQKVKNIAEPVEVFRVKLDGMAEPGTARPPEWASRLRWIAASLAAVLLAVAAAYMFLQQTDKNGPALPDKPSIAVLPFDNLSDDPRQTYFADGIAEDVMTDLSRLSGLFVIARNSSFAYRGKATDTRQVARELGVRYVLEGSVRRAADQIRINVQLIDGATGAHRWAERYDGSAADVFALQDKVTKAVVAALSLQLSPGDQTALSQRETAVPEAYDAFLRGWEHYRRATPEDYKQAIPHFERAIALDPDYGRAQAALAMIYFRGYDQYWPGVLEMTSDQALTRARQLMTQAKARPTALYHQVAGNISRGRGWHDDAVKEFKAAIALDPSDSWNFAELAHALIWAGKLPEAHAELDNAMRLDPRYPPVFLYYRGLAYFAENKLEDAAKTFEAALRISPELPLLRLFLAGTYGRSGRAKEAVAMIADYSAARVRQGGQPFVLLELAGNDALIWFNHPQRSRLVEGLRNIGIPYDYRDPLFGKHGLTGPEVDALVFGHRLRGRSLDTGQEHGATVSTDGSAAITWGDWLSGEGSTRIDGDRLCLVWSSNTTCVQILRNPGGSRAKENEYLWLESRGGWAYPFSQVQ